MLTSKGQGKGEVDSCFTASGEMLVLSDPGIRCSWVRLSSDTGWESRFIAIGFCSHGLVPVVLAECWLEVVPKLWD